MRGLDINWDKINTQIQDIVDKASSYLSSEEGQGFLGKVKTFFKKIGDWFASLKIGEWFSSLFD